MRIKFSFVLIIMLSLLSLQAVFVEIGDGTNPQSYVPAYGFYDQNWSRTIYLQTDLGDAQSFNEISYQLANTPGNYEMVSQTIYLKHTTETSITDVAFNNPATDESFTEVFAGIISWNGNGWFNITFDTPFAYNGTDNLELYYTNEDGSYANGYPSFFTTSTEDTRSIHNYQDGQFPETDGLLVHYFPNIRFHYPVENEPSPPTLIAPDNNAVNVSTTAELEWTMSANTDYVNIYLSNNYQLVESLDASVLVAEENSTETYTTAELIGLNIYYWRAVAYNNTTDFEAPSIISIFTTDGGDNVISIGDGSVTSQGLPCEPYYGYSISQTIYPQEWFNVDNQRIEAISYHYNGNQAWSEDSVTIWMGHTDLDSFGSDESWVSIDDLVIVYEGAMSLQAVDSWITFQLPMPFNYNNTQNLVVGFEQNTDGYHASADEFFCTEVESNLSLEKHTDFTDLSFIDPPEGVLKQYIPNTIFAMGETSVGPQVSVTPNSYEWSDTIINSFGEEKTFTVLNTGLGTLTLNSVTLDQDVDFILTDTNTYPIDIEDQFIEFTVTFNPQSATELSCNIVLTDASNNVTNIPLSGSGYDVMITEFPYFQGFENDPVNSLPENWASIIDSFDQYSFVKISQNFVYEGNKCVRFATASVANASLALVTPPVQNLSTKQVRFVVKSSVEGTGMIVGTYDGQVDTSVFTPIDTIAVTLAHTQHTVSFEDYSGTANMIGFQYVGTDDAYVNSAIDNVIIEYVPTGPAIFVMADTLDFGEVYLNRQGFTFFTIANWGIDNLVGSITCDEPYYTFGTTDFELEPTEDIQFEVTFLPQEEGEFFGSFTVFSNDANNPQKIVYGRGFVLPAISDDLTIIGNGELIDQHIPIEPYYGYTYSQVIYYPGEIGVEGQQIEKIAWFYNGNTAWSGDALKIYLGHTDLNEFEDDNSWIDISECMLVFDGVLNVTTEPGWIEFELDTPFVYDYTRNLVVAVEENTEGYHAGNDDFLCTASDMVRSIGHCADNIDADPTDPPVANFRMNSFANLKLEFGDIPDEPALIVFPANNTFPMTEINCQSDVRLVTFRSIGLQNIIIADAPTISGTDADQFAISTDSNSYPLTLPFNDSAQLSLMFTPTSEGSKDAFLEIVDNATRITHQININGHAYIDDGNASATTATILDVPILSETFSIMPENDVDWYKFPSLGILDTLIIYTEMPEDNYINLTAWFYGPVTNPDDIDLSLPLASDSYGHGNQQPEMFIEIPENGDYYLRIAENIVTPTGTNSPSLRKNPNGDSTRNNRNNIGLYELTVDAIFNYDFNVPLNLQATNSTGFVSLSWTEPPYERFLVSYDIYKDGEQINNVPLEENTFNDANVIVGTEYTYTVVAVYEEPNGQSLHSNVVSITYFTTGEPLFGDDFEAHNDFTLNMPNWIQYDEDGATTYGISGVDFENSGEPMSYIVFNPSMARYGSSKWRENSLFICFS